MITHYIHPGKILRDEYFAEMGISQVDAAKATGIPQSRLSEILSGRRGITADTAYRLGKFFGVEPQGFINLQAHYDLAIVEAKLKKEAPRRKIESYTKFAAHAV